MIELLTIFDIYPILSPYMISEDRINEVNRRLNSVPLEKLKEEGKKQSERDEKDFQELKKLLSEGKCKYCRNLTTYFSKSRVCYHWLLNPKRFKKKHFPLLYKQKGFHEINAYLRWVANCENPIKNINDLTDEKSPSKIIEETIKYKNIEWSFSCSQNDFLGHKDSYEGKESHYHFQMKVDGNVIISYNNFHLPFNDYDDFCFAVEDNKFERLKGGHFHGAGMQTYFDRIKPEDMVEHMMKADNEEEAQFDVGIVLQADEGSTISGDELAELYKERERTGVSMSKLVQKLKNVKVNTIISPGPGVPEIAKRKKNRN